MPGESSKAWMTKDSTRKCYPEVQACKGGSSFGTWNNGSGVEYVSRATRSQGDASLNSLAGDETLIYHEGDITSQDYRDCHTALVQISNCVAVKPHGLSETMANRYPYSNPYSSRRSIGALNRAHKEDRAVPGTINVRRSNRNSRDPVVVNMFGQYYMGQSIESNQHTLKIFSELQGKSRNERAESSGGYNEPQAGDDDLLKGLLSDTQENRIRWFRECLGKLVSELPKMDVKRVIFPYKIGCGLAGGNWERDYFPAIKDFVSEVTKIEIKVIIVREPFKH
ncbi:uncharacterized protein LOC135221013 isoform X2 [Macrobrachium nipponense]|uniref:uncharacterized protein LOC135221013 isoform X2 n=1 Tax=Macrobrachium nipponense TaxID=159736 RepID=UPI0030C8288E